MKRAIVICVAMLLAACGTVRKVESGAAPVGERMTLTLVGAWNHIDFPGIKPAQLWTMEGATIDELLIYSGIKDGTQMHNETPSSARKKPVVFRSGMQIEELVTMFEAAMTADDSTFKLLKVEPFPFGGVRGVRFEYERVRKVDNVRQLGVGFAAVDKGELFAMLYQAPRLTFFPRHRDRVEAMAKTVLIKGSPSL